MSTFVKKVKNTIRSAEKKFGLPAGSISTKGGSRKSSNIVTQARVRAICDLRSYGLTFSFIANMLNSDTSTIIHLYNKYSSEKK